jgi:hypothetical protein
MEHNPMKKTTTAIPFLDDFAPYVAARQKLLALEKQRDECRLKQEETLAKMQEDPLHFRRERAERLLAGVDSLEDLDEAAAQNELLQLERREQVIKDAIRLQAEKVEQEHLIASREICAQAAAPYRALVLAHVQAVLAAAQAAQEITNFLNGRGDIRRTADLPNVTLRPFHEPLSYGGVFGYWLRELQANGILTGKEPWLPKVLLPTR